MEIGDAVLGEKAEEREGKEGRLVRGAREVGAVERCGVWEGECER